VVRATPGLKGQTQHHGPRAPRGKPKHTVRISARVPVALYRKFMREGGSGWLRQLMERA
jgi:hypothetical protein